MEDLNKIIVDGEIKNEKITSSDLILTDAQIEQIADRAKDKALNDLYVQIGRGMITKLLYVIGSSLTGLAIFIASKFHRGD
jgi:hypothetical protein